MKYWNLLLLLILFLIIVIPQMVVGQEVELFDNNGEVYFSIPLDEISTNDLHSSKISFDHQTAGGSLYGYTTSQYMQTWLMNNYSAIELLPHPGTLHNPKMKAHVDIKSIDDWDYYPTYAAYLDMMNQFEENYPNLCKVESIGQSEEGREIMMAVISSDAGVQTGKAQVLYTSSMHGDELAGYVLFLRLIDYLLSEYGSNSRVTNMIDNLVIWINPLANPDGAYASGNSTVFGATRFNSNGVDLNRNYPDPEEGDHPDGNGWQEETKVFMQLAEEEQFVVALNCHGGNEVFNYPWDTWPQLPADDDWWNFVGREWADTVHANAPGDYFDGFDNGVTNGYQWYSISGGRQDYMNYFYHCREVTLEISLTKLLPENQLDDFWEYNYRSFLNYIEQSLYGIQGSIAAAGTAEPLRASVFLNNHDEDESWIVSNDFGFFYRPVYTGVYDVSFYRPGYELLTIEGVEVENYSITQLDVELVATSSAISENNFDDLFGLKQVENKITILYDGKETLHGMITLVNSQGQLILSKKVSFSNNMKYVELSTASISSGLYFVNITTEKATGSLNFLKN